MQADNAASQHRLSDAHAHRWLEAHNAPLAADQQPERRRAGIGERGPESSSVTPTVKVRHIEERCPRCGMAMVWWPPGQRKKLDCVDARCRSGVKP